MKLLLLSLLTPVASTTALSWHGSASPNRIVARDSPPPVRGVGDDGYYHLMWTDIAEPNATNYTNEDGGTYSFSWSGQGFATAGKGWSPGDNERIIKYNGTYQPNGYALLSAWGWTQSPLVEYYIAEAWGGSYGPGSAAARKGIAFCNNANYIVGRTTRVSAPSGIDGTLQTYDQFWSERMINKTPRGPITGEIDFGCHVRAWKSFGMELGEDHAYQLVAVEGYFSRGSARITVTD